MYKEMIISILIIILIFIGDFLTQKYTEKTVNELTSELENLKVSLTNNEAEKAEREVEKIDEKWEKVHDKLAYYIEHDELEKAETNFTACKSLTKSKKYVYAVSELDKMVFILYHIADKYSFSLENIL